MTTWMRKLRALARLSGIGGIVGAVLGVTWSVGSWLLGYSWLNLATLVWGGAVGGGMGAATGAFFAGATAVLEDGKDLREISVSRAAIMGVIGGALSPVLVMLAVAGTAGLGAQGLLTVAGASGALGGTLVAGAVASAKLARPRLRDPAALALPPSHPDQC